MNRVIAFFLLGLCFTGCGEKPKVIDRSGQRLPSIKLLLMDSATVIDTKSIPLDKPLAVCLIGPYCPYSRAQIVDILNDDLIRDKVRFYFITNWPYSEMKAIASKYQFGKYSNINAGVDYNRAFSNYFQAENVPFIAVFGKDMLLKKAFMGRTRIKDIEAAAFN